MSSKYLVKEESLTSVADAIREKTNTSDPMLFPSEFISNIESIVNTGDDIVAAINASSSLIDDDNLSVEVRDAVAKAHDVHTIADVTELQDALDLKETITGATTKANAAESNAKTYADDQDALKADKTYVDSKVQTDVPINAKFTDTIYSHPSSHPASMITGLPTSLPADGGNADTVGGFTVGTNVPSDAKFTDTVSDIDISGKADITYVDGKVKTDVPVGAEFTDTVYTHPTSHPASMITESSTQRFVSDSEKLTWNSKSDTTYSEITTAEIDTGTASTLRTITGRRVKYILDKVQGWIGGLTKTDVGLSNVDNVKQMPISGGVLEDYREKLVTLSGTSTAIDLSLGSVFTHTLAGNTTYSISTAVSGQAHSFTLIINQTATSRTLTFPASVIWQGGEIPDLSNRSKTYILTFVTVDGGTTWLGMFGGEF